MAEGIKVRVVTVVTQEQEKDIIRAAQLCMAENPDYTFSDAMLHICRFYSLVTANEFPDTL